MRVVDQIARTLKEAGVKRVFGLPGGASLPLIDGLKQEGIDFVLVRNESSAVFMAETSARLSGVPGVVIVTLGPGATNAYAGVANAWLDRSPVLIITADFPEEMKVGHTHQVLDLEAIFQPVTKWTDSIKEETAAITVAKALELTQIGRPGPVHLRLSGQVGDALVGDEYTTLVNEAPFFDQPTIDYRSALQLLRRSRRPIVVLGLGLEPERPYAEIKRLAESLQAPVIDLPKSKGAFPASHPLFVGTIGLTQRDPAYTVLEEADCVIAIGFDPVELVKPWQHPAPLLWINNWENADPKIGSAISLVGPLLPILSQLFRVNNDPDPDWGAARVEAYRQKERAKSLPAPIGGRLLPQTVLQSLQANLPSDTLITTDVGSHKILAALDWPAEHPNRYMVSNGLSAMGFGLPAAIAANLELDQPTLALHGDGGFQMVMGELGLLTQSGRCVISVVLNDSALDLIRAKQLRRAESPYGTEFVNPDFADIARGYRLDYYCVHDRESCDMAIQQALANKRPAIIEALIDPISYPTAVNMGNTP